MDHPEGEGEGEFSQGTSLIAPVLCIAQLIKLAVEQHARICDSWDLEQRCKKQSRENEIREERVRECALNLLHERAVG